MVLLQFKCPEVAIFLVICHLVPYKAVHLQGLKKVIDEDDQRLKELKAEWELEVCKAVTVALMELNEYNPGGRYCVDEIWNFRENRRASLREGIEYVVKRAFRNQ